MKQILYIIIFISLAFYAKAQLPTGVPTQKINGWIENWYTVPDSGTVVSKRDTFWTPSKLGMTVTWFHAGVDTVQWFWNGVHWGRIAASQLDTTSLSNRINLKVNISDTAAMLAPYLRKSDTTNKWVQNVYARNDSLFKLKNGTETFIHVAPTSGGGTVTSVGLSLPAAMSVTPSTITTSGTFNVSGAGTASQYVKGNFTLGTTDTSMIPNFFSKVQGLFTGVSPITYSNGLIGVLNANASGQKGAATFNNSDFTDNGVGGISLSSIVSTGGCSNCQLTITNTGRVSSYSNGTSPSASVLETFYGSIYNKFSWTNLTDFIVNGGATVSITANNKISITGGTAPSDFTKNINFNYYTCLSRWMVGTKITIVDKTSTSYGVGIGTFAVGGWSGHTHDISAKLDLTNSGTSGFVTMYVNDGSFHDSVATSGVGLSFNAGDSIEFTIQRSLDSVIAIAKNIGTGTKVSASFVYNTLSSFFPISNLDRFAVYNFGGTQILDSLNIGSRAIKNADILILGDSKSVYYANKYKFLYGSLLDRSFISTEIDAGPGDRTPEVLLRLPEVKAMNPKQVLIQTFRNDTASGMTFAQSTANLVAIADSLTNWGIKFYFIPFSETSIDLTQWYNWIVANYPNNFINTWSLFQNPAFLQDGIHPTPAAHDTLSKIILNSFKVTGGGNRYTVYNNLQAVTDGGDSTNNRIITNGLLSTNSIRAELTPDQFAGWPYITSFSKGKIGASGTEPSLDILIDSTSASLIGQLAWRTSKKGTNAIGNKINLLPSSRCGPNAIALLECNTNLGAANNPITWALFMGDSTNSNINFPFIVYSPGAHSLSGSFRQYFTVNASEALFFGTGPSRVNNPAFSTINSFFAGDLNNLPAYLLNSPRIAIDTTNNKLLVHNSSTGATQEMYWPTTLSGNTLYTGDGTANNRTVTVTGNQLTFTSTLTSPTATVAVNNTSSGHGLIGNASGAGYGLYGIGFRGVYGNGSGGGTGVYGQETSGIGLRGVVTTGTALEIDHTPTSFSDIQTSMLITRLTSGNSGNGANGIGTGFQFGAPTTTTTSASVGGAFNWYWATATNASRSGAFSLQTVTNAGSLTTKMIVGDNFQLNSSNSIFAKIDGTVPYTSAIGLLANNNWQFAYTPTAAVFSKGNAITIDTNNNVSLGSGVLSTSAPLYATGGSTLATGFQSSQGNFAVVNTILAGTTALSLQYYFIQCDATAGNITLNLPAASTAFGANMGIRYVFYRVDATGNTVTINAAGADSINQTGSFTLAGQNTTKQLQCVSSSKWAQY